MQVRLFSRAEWGLVLVTALWGTTFPLISFSVRRVDPFTFVAVRFIIATVACFPLIVRSKVSRPRRLSGRGLALGALFWTAYTMQTIGLKTVEAGRAGFLAASTVVLVPLLGPVFGHGRPRVANLVAAAVALAGVLLLSASSTSPLAGAEAVSVGTGEGWVLGCAAVVAVHIHVLQRLVRAGLDPAVLTFSQIVGVASCAVLFAAIFGTGPSEWEPESFTATAFCAVFATVLPLLLQARCQSRTTPTRAGLIFTLEAVFAYAFAFALFGEELHGSALFGAALVITAVVGSTLRPAPMETGQHSPGAMARSETCTHRRSARARDPGCERVGSNR